MACATPSWRTLSEPTRCPTCGLFPRTFFPRSSMRAPSQPRSSPTSVTTTNRAGAAARASSPWARSAARRGTTLLPRCRGSLATTRRPRGNRSPCTRSSTLCFRRRRRTRSRWRRTSVRCRLAPREGTTFGPCRTSGSRNSRAARAAPSLPPARLYTTLLSRLGRRGRCQRTPTRRAQGGARESAAASSRAAPSPLAHPRLWSPWSWTRLRLRTRRRRRRTLRATRSLWPAASPSSSPARGAWSPRARARASPT
mmetsp:Transcript_16988/g.58157  ORF Transcript_16988/g.58157 Transcript_16988/m.58157 type:complete len:254 (-) Transcript_16988:80-841(-)